MQGSVMALAPQGSGTCLSCSSAPQRHDRARHRRTAHGKLCITDSFGMIICNVSAMQHLLHMSICNSTGPCMLGSICTQELYGVLSVACFTASLEGIFESQS